jgi:phage/plasmid primase-like uncharacterized protein
MSDGQTKGSWLVATMITGAKTILAGKKALEAAEAVAGVAIFPNFTAEQRSGGFTDFNDLGTLKPEVVSRQLDEVFHGVTKQRLAVTQSIELVRALEMLDGDPFGRSPSE